jgi:hypothetical protein
MQQGVPQDGAKLWHDSCNIPRFCQILGEFFFPFVLLEMIEISQGIKILESIRKFY